MAEQWEPMTWRDMAGCTPPASMDIAKWTAIFYPVPLPKAQNLTKEQWDRPAAICARCPVREQCLEDALLYEPYLPARHGMRGGMLPSERTALARRRGLEAEELPQQTLPLGTNWWSF